MNLNRGFFGRVNIGTQSSTPKGIVDAIGQLKGMG